MQYVLGLDIGITSVGWAVLDLDQQRIEDLGVRMFDRAENPKDGAPLAEPRRQARGARRRLRRRRWRLDGIRDLFITQGLIPPEGNTALFETAPGKPDPWELRVAGLDRALTGIEFARALYHMAKRRGFLSNRKVAKDKEEGIVLDSIKKNRMLMSEKGYRTAAEMLVKDPCFLEHRRNKVDSYDNSVDRLLIEDEARILFRQQRAFGNTCAREEVEHAFLALFNAQLPVATGDEILKKVGDCTFEKTERRAARCAYTTERSILMQKVNHLSYQCGAGKTTRCSPEQRGRIVELAYAHESVTYKQIRKALALPDDARFVGLDYRGKRRKTEEEKPDDPLASETKPFVKLPGFHALRTAFKGSASWDAVRANPELMDDLAIALTLYKTDDDIRAYLRERGVGDEIIEGTLHAPTFSKFSHLSLKALRVIMPFLEEGAIYSEACRLAGYDHTATATGEKKVKLPVIDPEEIRNPVVLRALTQARKVVNAVISRYGSPYRIHIEVAREMRKNFLERKEIEREQVTNQKAREEDLEHFREVFPQCLRPSGEDLLKWRLYREQNGQCAYTQMPLVLENLLDPGYAEIDHIIPYSRSFDDSMANKVLVFASENRKKKNQTPYEYFGHDAARWERFTAWVGTIKGLRKRRNLLEDDFDARKEEEWKQRSLNDTQWIAREFSGFIREHLAFADPALKVPVVCIKGQVTAMVRGIWGLGQYKDRAANDLHHALDAAVVATLTTKQIQRITEYRKRRELLDLAADDVYTDSETGEVTTFRVGRHFMLPQPWMHFREELLARLSENPAAALASLALPTYADKPAPRPIFVSRMPRRKATGPIHKETVRSVKYLESDGNSVVRTALASLKMADLDDLVAPAENVRLYSAIRERLAAYGGDGKQAFGDSANPFRKPTVDGSPGPIVRTVKLGKTQNTGLPVRDGIADNGSMVRVDVFQKHGRFFLVPVYVADVMRGQLPDRAILANMPESAWPVMDETYRFLFSLYPFDLVRVKTKKEEYFGYYRMTDRSTGAIVLTRPNCSQEDDKTGVKLATGFEKYVVDVLGEYHLVKKEVRRGLESRGDQQPCTVAG